MKNAKFRMLNSEYFHTFAFWGVIGLALIALSNLLHPGIFLGHDTPDHVARIANFYHSLSEGILVPRWAANLNWGYGHPILMFLYPLPSYIASVFRALGFSFVDSTKLVFATAYLASIGAMYLWMKEQFGKNAGVVGALLYGFAPYRFIDLYVRGAIGEHVAFVFPPLIGLGLLRIARKQSVSAFSITALATAGLILGHNALSLMFLPVLGVYGLYLVFFETKKPLFTIAYSLVAILLGFGLSAFFWMPAFFEGKYTLRDIVTAGEFAARMVPVERFFSLGWHYGGAEMSRSLGVLPWLGILAAFFTLVKTKTASLKVFLLGGLAILVVAVVLMTDIATPVWRVVTLLQKFQFPWRILSVTTLVAAAVGAAVVSALKEKISRYIVIATFILTAATTFYMWKAVEYKERPEEHYSGIYMSTTDTGESSPIWSIRFMERVPPAPMEAILPDVKIERTVQKTTYQEYRIATPDETRVIAHTLYFPGWVVYVDDKPVVVQYQDPAYRGLMTFTVPQGNHTVKLVFGDTKKRMFANWISIASTALLMLITVIPGVRTELAERVTRNPFFKRWIPKHLGFRT